MNNLQTGQFIKQLRKEQGMTQRKLAEKLNISEKTVSKWETGNGLPDTGIMLPLSKVLGITVNELLAGQRLDSVNYAVRAEENIKMFLQDKVSGKAKSLTALISSVLVIISSLALIVICAGYAQVEIWLRITLIIIGFFNIFAFTALVCILGASSEIFECSECGKKHCGEKHHTHMSPAVKRVQKAHGFFLVFRRTGLDDRTYQHFNQTASHRIDHNCKKQAGKRIRQNSRKHSKQHKTGGRTDMSQHHRGPVSYSVYEAGTQRIDQQLNAEIKCDKQRNPGQRNSIFRLKRQKQKRYKIIADSLNNISNKAGLDGILIEILLLLRL